MDVNDKIRSLKQEIEKVSSEEAVVKARISDLKRLVEEKSRRLESLAKLKETETALLKELGL